MPTQRISLIRAIFDLESLLDSSPEGIVLTKTSKGYDVYAWIGEDSCIGHSSDMRAALHGCTMAVTRYRSAGGGRSLELQVDPAGEVVLEEVWES